MRFLKFTLLLSIVLFSAFTCEKEDQPTSTFIMPYDVQYGLEKGGIEKFLDEYKMTASAANNYEDVVFSKLPTPIDASQSIRTVYTANDMLKTKMIKSNGVNYKVYYIQFREGAGDGPEQQNPVVVDSVLVNYRGMLLNKKSNYSNDKSFEENQTFDSKLLNPVWFVLKGTNSLIEGWQKIFPLFKPGGYTVNPSNNQFTYNDFGAGVMFLPSGLGYYATPLSTIPAYSPLIFTFSLKRINHVDNDFDHIDTRYEDIDGDGSYYDDDTDGDGIANYFDIDDDGDGKLTSYELKIPTGGYYSFENAPDCSGNTTDPMRKRKYLDKNCQ
ncbi:hypothetical protein EQG63_09395 [Flavobacterium amnicola]|uniref:peptidylprolyl isomerase n=1 Tax=Flavobacterium amnicola TaxID=2506422 RepID=A0A4Q1K1A4_9FLAO|nr:hypothetical protein [Flavobacterium amnicola]RXR17694.1 hypothetical protein EQG63_09395 [Flavobacterium amnicola]